MSDREAMMRAVIGVAAVLALAGCGKSGGSTGGAAPSGSTGGGWSAPSGWKATDACATLDKAKVAAATGAAVKSATLSGVTEARDGMAAVSTCIYALDNGGSIGVLTRESPDDSEPPADYVKQSADMGMKLEPVAGVGRTAFWADGLKSLQVFVDKRRYTAINYSMPPEGADAKGAATKIAHDLGG